MNYNKIAATLDQASFQAKATEQISHHHAINLDEAYAIQSIAIARRYIRGEKLVGLKLGFTSKAKMEQMGVHDMIWGRLTDKMYYPHGSKLKIDDFIHPRAEPEIAFRVSKTIDKEITLENAKNYVDGLAVAIEIIDSRYKHFKFSLEDVVADNCSSAGFTFGDWFAADTNIQNIDMSLSFDDKLIEQGNSNAILGNPWESFVAAARLARDNGEVLQKGAIILAGAATSAAFIIRGSKVSARAAGLGEVNLQIV